MEDCTVSAVIKNYDGIRISWANRWVHTARSAIGEIVYDPGGYCGPRTQLDYELVIIHSGACTVSIDHTSRELAVGKLHLFYPRHREHYTFSTQTQTHHSWCTISPKFMPRNLQQKLEKAPLAVPVTETVQYLLKAASQLRLPKSFAAEKQIDFLALCLFAEFLRLSDEAIVPPGWNHPAYKAERWMEDHYSEEDCLARAIQASGVSKNALSYKFREQFHTTPGRYLWKLRTERGIALLGASGHNISEIAYNCGFKNPFHFSRLVKQHQGESPHKIRTRIWRREAEFHI